MSSRFANAGVSITLALLVPGCVVGGHAHYSWSIDTWESASREVSANLAIESGDRLVIGGATGDVTLTTRKGVTPHFVATITGHGETVADAERVRDAYRIVTERTGRDVVVRVVGEPIEYGDENVKMSVGSQVTFSVIAPEGISLDLRTAHGKIVARGPVANCALDSSYGDVSVTDATGSVTASSASGDVRLSNVTGPLAEARSGYGKVEMDAVRADRIVAKSSSGRVTLSRTEGATTVDAGYGDIVIEDGSGSLAASTSAGDITISGFSEKGGGPATVDLDSGFGEIELSGVLGALTAESASGDVDVEALPGSRIAADWRLRSGYGNVELDLPADASGTLDARTNYGVVECDFPMRIEAGRASAKELRGRIGETADGVNTIRLESSSGDIRLRRAASD